MSHSTSKHTPRRHSRREFLKTSAGAVSAAALANVAIERTAHAAGSDILKVGLIGCGGRGSGAGLQALNADNGARLVAMADVFEDRLKGARQRLAGQKGEQVAVADDQCFAGLDGGLKVIQSGVDVVLIACASRYHPEYLQAAVEAGKHVFVEKPHAIDPPGVRTVMAACELAAKKNLNVVSGLCYRYDPGMRETMKRIFDGAIGEIVAIQETYMRSPYRLIEREPGQKELEYQYRNWYHFRWLSGDDVPQSLLHSIDKGAWALRDEIPEKAFGLGGRSSSVGTVFGDVFDHASIVFEYANGVRMYAHGRAQNGCYNEVSDVFLGTKGRCYLMKKQIEGQTNWKYEGPKSNMYDVEHQELFASIRAGKPINNGLYMARSTMMAVLGQMAVYSGKQITWEDAMKSQYIAGPGPAQCSWDMDPPVKPDANGIYPVPIPGMMKLS